MEVNPKCHYSKVGNIWVPRLFSVGSGAGSNAPAASADLDGAGAGGMETDHSATETDLDDADSGSDTESVQSGHTVIDPTAIEEHAAPAAEEDAPPAVEEDAAPALEENAAAAVEEDSEPEVVPAPNTHRLSRGPSYPVTRARAKKIRRLSSHITAARPNCRSTRMEKMLGDFLYDP